MFSVKKSAKLKSEIDDIGVTRLDDRAILNLKLYMLSASCTAVEVIMVSTFQTLWNRF